MKREHWREDAACVGQDSTIFFPTQKGSDKERWDRAKSICAFCSVRRQCLDLVINLEQHDDRWGVFGGLSPMERRRLRTQRKSA